MDKVQLCGCADGQILLTSGVLMWILRLGRLGILNANYEHSFYILKFENMTTLTIEIDNESDLPALQAVLGKMGLKYHVDEEGDDDWGGLPETAIEGIKAGMADSAAGRLHTHEEVMARISSTLDNWRKSNG